MLIELGLRPRRTVRCIAWVDEEQTGAGSEVNNDGCRGDAIIWPWCSWNLFVFLLSGNVLVEGELLTTKGSESLTAPVDYFVACHNLFWCVIIFGLKTIRHTLSKFGITMRDTSFPLRVIVAYFNPHVRGAVNRNQILWGSMLTPGHWFRFRVFGRRTCVSLYHIFRQPLLWRIGRERYHFGA